MIWDAVKKLSAMAKKDAGGTTIMPMAALPEEGEEHESAEGMLRIGKLHEQGKREEQQDSFGVSCESLIPSRGLLAVVADGMGGLENGGEVSATVVETVLDGFTLYQGSCTPEQLLLFLAKQAVESVNELLGASGFGKSGSTLVMGIVQKAKFSFLSIGDSRVCLYRQGILIQLNREHTYKNELARNAVIGEIPLQEVYTDSRGSGLTSFLGMNPLAHIDFPAEPVKLIPGDKLLLMSDGVYNALDRQELAKCLEAAPDEAAGRIHQEILAKEYDNQDNYTAVIIEYEA